ncbi:MAG TPA: FAD-binding protein [Ignavibacteria bacterium]|nr:FAD-binding protein [Ignavibacteria bacterium]
MEKYLESVPKNTSSVKTKIEFQSRKRWYNCVKSQIVEPLRYYKPASLSELTEIIRYAGEKGFRVKAVGSGHSFSPIMQTTDFLINCHSMNKIIELDKNILKTDSYFKEKQIEFKHIAHVENGISIKELNNFLDTKDLALINMGGFDAQTIAGVISTSTHGTGITLGPIASSVLSIILVGESGKIFRIEPEDGISDPEKYRQKYPDNTLIQENDFFNAVLVNMGCMGVIYSVIMKVTDSYLLEEKREGNVNEMKWSYLKEVLRKKEIIKLHRHFEVWVNPYKIDGDNNCLITTKDIYTGETEGLTLSRRVRNIFSEFFAASFEIVIRYYFKLFYSHAPQILRYSMRGVIDKDGYINKSYKVLHLGAANKIKSFSSEYAVSLEDDKFIKAVDIILEQAERLKDEGNIYHTVPISLRFVKRCDAFFSMMHGEDKCLIEVPMLKWTYGGFQILSNIEKELIRLGARPHWGQYNELSGNNDLIRTLYPEYDKWIAVFNILNKNGTFDNDFTDTCGFSKIKF